MVTLLLQKEEMHWRWPRQTFGWLFKSLFTTYITLSIVIQYHNKDMHTGHG